MQLEIVHVYIAQTYTLSVAMFHINKFYFGRKGSMFLLVSLFLSDPSTKVYQKS